MGRDRHQLACVCRSVCFNPRARVGRDSSLRPTLIIRSSFNPRARVGRDTTRPGRSLMSSVSIHAPAWGATDALTTTNAAALFQSTRPRGARLMGITSLDVDAWFQSTRPRGARPWLLSRLDKLRGVSIHAPAWGATSPSPSPSSSESVSIHAPAWGATSFTTSSRTSYSVSIHAPAWGATCGTATRFSGAQLFQSTRPRGARRSLSFRPAAVP